MITHSITPYKSAITTGVSSYSGGHNNHPYYQQWRHKKTMGKYEYAQHLSKMGLEVGDFIVSKTMSAPYQPGWVSQIVDICEIHMMVSGYDSDGKPQAYQCQSMNGTPWWTTLLWAKKVDHEDVPEYWKARQRL